MIRLMLIISVVVLFLYFIVEIEDSATAHTAHVIEITDDKKIKFKSLIFNYSPEDIVDKAHSLIGKVKLVLFSSNAVNIVKEGKIDERLTIGEWVSGIVGVRGTLSWKELVPENYDNRIKIVQLDMAREDGKKAKIQWLVNTDTKNYNINYIELNGEAKPVLMGVMELELWPVGDLFKMIQ